MLPAYRDILKRINEEPIWYEESGVPRYDKFKPEMLGIYDDIAVYYQIACQACERKFYVGEGISLMQRLKSNWMKAGLAALNSDKNQKTLEEIKIEYDPKIIDKKQAAIEYGMTTPHFGDPPRHNIDDKYRCVGEVENCIDLEILEFWIKDQKENYEWQRFPEFEGVIKEENQ